MWGIEMTWSDYLVLGALVCILAGTGLSLVDEDMADNPAPCRFLSAILLNAAVVLVAIAWRNGAL